MLPQVVQDVYERVSHLSRRLQRSGVIPLAPHRAVASKNAVDRLGDADREALDAARQTAWRVGFHEQVHVSGLNAELEEAEGLGGCTRKSPAYH